MVLSGFVFMLRMLWLLSVLSFLYAQARNVKKSCLGVPALKRKVLWLLLLEKVTTQQALVTSILEQKAQGGRVDSCEGSMWKRTLGPWEFTILLGTGLQGTRFFWS